MIRKQAMLATAIGLLWTAGCDRPKEAVVVPEPKPAAQAVAPVPLPAVVYEPTTQPAAGVTRVDATVAPIVSNILYLHIFERADLRYPFPLARLHINAADHTAVLYSDDPKAAVDADYSGNSFYLVVPLDKDLKLDGYVWENRTSSGDEAAPSTEGIFLDGQRFRLQPADIHVAFKLDGGEAHFSLFGDFVKFDSKSSNPHLGFDAKVMSGWQPIKLDRE